MERKEYDMSNDIIKGLGYAHMAIAAKDFDKSLAFYKALGLTVYTQWGTGDTRIALEAGATSVKAPCEAPLDSHPLRLTLRVAFVKGPSGEELEFFKTVVKPI